MNDIEQMIELEKMLELEKISPEQKKFIENMQSRGALAGVFVGYLLGYSDDKCEAKSVNKLKNVYVEFLGNIDTISDIDLEDLKELSKRMYQMAIAEKTRRLLNLTKNEKRV